MMSDAMRRVLRWKSRAASSAQDCLCNPDGSPKDRALPMLFDLARWCFADRTTHMKGPDGRTDVEAMLIAEGRRQAWFRLCELMNLDPHAVLESTNGVPDV